MRAKVPEFGPIASSHLFMAQGVAAARGPDAHYAGLIDALRFARMRVDEQQIDEVAQMLGATQLAECPSLPSAMRQRAGTPLGRDLILSLSHIALCGSIAVIGRED
ncbi:hypothetical protein LQ954_14085 [Sphingomonas sp. IC-11]|uniref:hypothetical protein n=1 Tax=Sphingomonas sp. IC-11 TaxID=2898528 RepID=UPI001E56789B|nr:hypothetical protein [Sphingomonas sp. IC-11]MCD2317273.1 hypothetical protein [Sphingomonas sp. IC-11]